MNGRIVHRVRPASASPDGALVLLHGRGADELDLLPLMDALDPGRRLVGLAPRGPLSLPPGGSHWYAVHRIGFPDPGTFLPTFQWLSAWLDATLAEHGIGLERTVIGGFSQGAVMTYALSLARGRTAPAGLFGLSGFLPTVDGFDLDLARPGLPVAIGHGTYDPVIGVEFGRDARDRLTAAGLDVVYRESAMAHSVDPAFLDEIVPWLGQRVPPRATA